MANFKNYFKLLNHPSKIIPMINYTLLTIYGAIITNSNSSIIACISLLLIIIAINFAWFFSVGINDYYDIEIDSIINPNRPLIKGDLTKKEVKKFFLFTGTIALISSFLNSLLSTFWSLLLIGIYILLGIFYSTPPIRIKMRTSLSTLIIGISCSISILAGGLSILDNNSSFNIFGRNIFNYNKLILISISIGIISFMVSLTKDFKDIPGDKTAGIPTLPIKYGAEKAAKILLVIGVISYAVFFLYLIFDKIYFFSYPFIIFAIISWILIYIYYIKMPGKERAEILYKLGFMGFLIIIISFIILEFIF
ncbi:MAG: UbiA family prenyltransferase [Candidatus Hodarchaeota archaeon]